MSSARAHLKVKASLAAVVFDQPVGSTARADGLEWTRLPDNESGWMRVVLGRVHFCRWRIAQVGGGTAWGIDVDENPDVPLPWQDTPQVTLTRMFAHSVTRVEYRPEPPPDGAS